VECSECSELDVAFGVLVAVVGAGDVRVALLVEHESNVALGVTNVRPADDMALGVGCFRCTQFVVDVGDVPTEARVVVHDVLPCKRRERRELSAIGAYAKYPIIAARYVNYRT
jgi:hypothetical protein